MAFIGLFDKTEHDIAKTKSEIALFKKVMQTLFGEGGIFYRRETRQSIMPTRLPAIGGYFGVVGVKPMFVTEHIQKTLRRGKLVFNCGSEQVALWGPPERTEVEEVVVRLKNVTEKVLERADAEFEHLERFDCFL